MDGLQILYAFLELIGGIGVFLFGMKLMGDSLENVAGNKIKKMFNKITNKKLIGVGIGTAVTAVVQSSSPVTVMLVGFVNSGIMTLTQATPIIFGANLGTTITAQIVAWGYGGIENINMMAILASLAGIGAFIVMFAKSDKKRKIGSIITGLGMIFVGLAVMNNSMTLFSETPKIKTIIAGIQNPFLLILFGMLFTALIQSSSATTGIIIAMSSAQMLGFNQAMFIILGSNIGTCITALIASIGTNINGRRTAYMHLLFNLLGVIIFGITTTFVPYDKMFSVFPNIELQIAMLHTFFNLVTIIILLPFSNLMVKFICKITKERKSDKKVEEALHFYYIEENMLRTPLIAVAQLKKEVKNMADIAKTNFDLAIDSLVESNIDNAPTVLKNEKIINFLNREIIKFLVSLSHANISQRDKMLVGTTYHTISDIERVGDYAENIIEYAERMVQEDLKFSDDAKSEIRTLQTAIDNLYKFVIKTYTGATLSYIDKVNMYEESVDRLKETMANHHIERLSKGTCSVETGAIYLSFAANAERVADHMTNIAYAVRSYAKPEKIKALNQAKGK